jgi:esterase/lipase
MEKALKIQTPDKKFIYGTFTSAGKKSNALVIFAHGFTGHKDEHIFFNGAKFFTEKGFDTFRLNLYAGEGKNSRHFRDTKISLHGQDITTVVKHLRKKYKKIFVVGHSYGGTSLLFVDHSIVDGLVFWDASYINPAEDSTDHMKYNKTLNAYILDWGLEILVGKDFVNELKNFPDCGELIKSINKPVLFVAAGKVAKMGKKYFSKANNPKKLVRIKTADHNFNNWKDEETLFKETYNWLKQL